MPAMMVTVHLLEMKQCLKHEQSAHGFRSIFLCYQVPLNMPVVMRFLDVNRLGDDLVCSNVTYKCNKQRDKWKTVSLYPITSSCSDQSRLKLENRQNRSINSIPQVNFSTTYVDGIIMLRTPTELIQN